MANVMTRNRKLTESKAKPLPPLPRVEVLNDAIRCVSVDRNATHGEPEDSFAFIAALWDAYLTEKGLLADGERISRADVALMMGLQKVARAAVNPLHKDSWTDVAGYAACGYEAALVDDHEAKHKGNIVEVREEATGRTFRVS